VPWWKILVINGNFIKKYVKCSNRNRFKSPGDYLSQVKKRLVVAKVV
jgi:hypothetical protein